MPFSDRIPQKGKKRKISPSLRIVSKSDGRGNNPRGSFVAYMLVVLVLILTWYIVASDETSPIVQNPDGAFVLSPERQAKLDRELEELRNAVQYVLLAKVDGYYPCYSCPPGQNTIYLYVGEVWRYGVTRKGKEGRYPKGNYGAPNLEFFVEFMGDWQSCLIMEKNKIFAYPYLPEALKRSFVIKRPPGNKNDS